MNNSSTINFTTIPEMNAEIQRRQKETFGVVTYDPPFTMEEKQAMIACLRTARSKVVEIYARALKIPVDFADALILPLPSAEEYRRMQAAKRRQEEINNTTGFRGWSRSMDGK